MRWTGALVITCLTLTVACGPAIDRPVRGAVPGSAAPTAPGLPPTLQPSDSLRFKPLPSPSPALSANPAASPAPSPSAVAALPIVRTIQPAANGRVPANPSTTVSAVLVGRGADLATASLAVNGADAGAQIEKRSAREWAIHATQALPNGSYTARVLVQDTSGARGGFTWQISVGSEAPTPEPGG
jgi:hypothetical protein